MPSRIYADRITLNPAPGLSGSGFNKVNLYAGAGDPNGILSAETGDRYFQIGSVNKWVCTGTTNWTLDDGSDPADSRVTFTYQPGGTADPDAGLYTDWSECHAAAAIVAESEIVTIIIDDTITRPALIEAGTYDMANIKLLGIGALQADVPVTVGIPVGQARVQTGNTVFQNFTQGASWIFFDHAGNAPLFTVEDEGNVAIATGYLSSWRSSGGQPIFRTPTDATGGTLTIYTDPYTSFFNSAGPVVRSIAPSTLFINSTSRLAVANDTLAGDGNIEIVLTSPISSIASDQTPFSGALTLTRAQGTDIGYTPGAPADWADADPTTVEQALDRLAAAVEGLLGAPIPT